MVVEAKLNPEIDYILKNTRGLIDLAWAYDNPELRDLLHKGRVNLDVEHMEKTFKELVNEDQSTHCNAMPFIMDMTVSPIAQKAVILRSPKARGTCEAG